MALRVVAHVAGYLFAWCCLPVAGVAELYKDIYKPSEQTASVLRQSEQLLADGDVSEANRVIDQFLALQPEKDFDAASVAGVWASLLSDAAADRGDQIEELSLHYYRIAERRSVHQVNRALYANNLAIRLMKLGHDNAAVAALLRAETHLQGLQEFDLQAKVRYNIGRALERRGALDGAFAAYLDAVMLDPSMERAEEDSVRTIALMGSKYFENVAFENVIEELSASGLETLAESLISEALKNRRLSEGSTLKVVLHAIIDLIGVHPTALNAYENDWRHTLSGKGAGGPPSVGTWRLIDAVVRRPISLSAMMAEGDRSLAPLKALVSEFGENSVVEFLLSVAQRYSEENDVQQALARYVLAWQASAGGLEQGIYAINYVLRSGSVLRARQLGVLDWYRARLVEQGNLRDVDPFDRARMHALLGEAYSTEEKQDPAAAKLALDQWESALEILQDTPKLVEERGLNASSLHLKIGRTQAALGNSEVAFQRYLAAARDAIEGGNLEFAEMILTELPEAPDLEANQQLARLEDYMARHLGRPSAQDRQLAEGQEQQNQTRANVQYQADQRQAQVDVQMEEPEVRVEQAEPQIDVARGAPEGQQMAASGQQQQQQGGQLLQQVQQAEQALQQQDVQQAQQALDQGSQQLQQAVQHAQSDQVRQQLQEAEQQIQRAQQALEQDDTEQASQALQQANQPIQQAMQEQGGRQAQQQAVAGTETAAAAGAEAQHGAAGEETSALLAQIPASELLGTQVVDSEGDQVAEIVDMVKRTGTDETFAVLSVGGFLGIGEREVAMPLDRFDVGPEQQVILSGATEQELEEMPAWEEGDANYQGSIRQ